jgi:hypothetical protein
MNLLEKVANWEFVEANAPALCLTFRLVKVSRQSAKGQMENSGKREGKTDGMNEKSG